MLVDTSVRVNAMEKLPLSSENGINLNLQNTENA